MRTGFFNCTKLLTLWLIVLSNWQFVQATIPFLFNAPENGQQSQVLGGNNLQCGRISRLKQVILTNPSALPTNGNCQYTIEAFSPLVCQLHINFERFELQTPVLNSTIFTTACEDRLELNDFRFCGKISGQHIYVPFSGVRYQALRFVLPNRSSQTNWRLVVTQLECPDNRPRDRESLAPPGCDQYFRQPSGNIRSFNYDGVSLTYLPNMNYAICIKSQGNKLIEYTVRKFQFSQQNAVDVGYDGDCHSTVDTPGRREDYLMIPRATLVGQYAIKATYYCGSSLRANQAIYAPQPYMMYFKSDDIPGADELGFSFDYKMKAQRGG